MPNDSNTGPQLSPDRPNVPEGHKCSRLHGHSFRVEVRVQGEIHDDSGMVIDFAEIKAAFAPLHDAMDHRFFNEADGLANPTSENLARWIWVRLQGQLPLAEVVVRETCTSGVAYRGGCR